MTAEATVGGAARHRGVAWMSRALLLNALLVGCAQRLPLPITETFYSVTVENRTKQKVVASVMHLEWAMEPCSVRYEGAVPGPPLGTLVAVQATDTGGNVVFSAEVGGQSTAGIPTLNSIVTGNGADQCPDDQRQAYMLTFRNQLPGPIDISLGDMHLGRVASGEQGTFGPVPGDWSAHRDYILRDRSGHEMGAGDDYLLALSSVVYRLGETPELEVWVTEGFSR